MANERLETCGLCGQCAELCDSHIIPNWVYRDEIRGEGGSLIDLNESSTTLVP